MIYLDQRWAPTLLNYVCYWCLVPLHLYEGYPTCYFHGRGMWLHRNRKPLFQQLRRTVQAQEQRRELFGAL